MRPVLLLVPGMLNTAAVWRDVTPHLADAADVRIADVQTQATIAAMANDAWATVDDIGADVPLVLCGFSMGGYVAIEMLARPRRPVQAAGLLATSARPESADGVALREKTIGAIERDFDKVTAGIAQFGTDPARHGDAGFMAALLQLLRSVGAETAIRQNRAVCTRADHRGALASLRLPTLVMVGRADRITPPPLSEELASLIPHARLESIDGAGHMAPLEQPARVARLLRSLLVFNTADTA